MVPLSELISGYRACLEELEAQWPTVMEIANLIASAREVFIAGNGGSAATASHFVADLRHAGVKATCLADNVPTLTALANDVAFEYVFSEQLGAGRPGDALVVISASGNSPNLLRAAEEAQERGMATSGLLGFGGGKLLGRVPHRVVLSSRDYGEVEGVHSCLCHMIARIIKERR